MKDNQRLCPECGEIIHGRADKRFCSDQCRSQHNNRQNSDKVNLVRNINLLLKKNRRIMEGILQGASEPLKPKVIKREVLLRAGFDFTYMTHRRITRKGDIYSFCYDFGYREMDRDDLMIVYDEKTAEK